MALWHLTVASDGRLPLLPDERSVRAAVRLLAREAGDRMALFCAVDSHVHAVVLAEPAEASWLGRALTLGLRALAGTPTEPARRRPVEHRGHAESLLRYLLTQVGHHGLPVHPALWSGSCFQELAGARAVAGLQLRLREVLPRVRPDDIKEIVGLPARPVEPVADAAVRAAGAARLVAAAGAAVAADPALASRETIVVAARRAVVDVGLTAGLAVTDVAWALRVTRRAVERLRTRSPADAVLSRALRMRLALEDLVLAGVTPRARIG